MDAISRPNRGQMPSRSGETAKANPYDFGNTWSIPVTVPEYRRMRVEHKRREDAAMTAIFEEMSLFPFTLTRPAR